MAANLGGSRISNMGTVLNLLKEHLFWEQYLVLNIPIDTGCSYPLTFYPKDVLDGIRRAINIGQKFREDAKSYWSIGRLLPPCFDNTISRMTKRSDIFFKAIRYVNEIADDYDFAERFVILYRFVDNFEELVRTYNYEYKNLIEYLCFLGNYDGYDSKYDAINDLIDYNRMSRQICEVCDRKNKYEKYPHFLKSRHMIVTRNYKVLESEHKEELFEYAYDGTLEYSFGKYAIIEPKHTVDILKEANEMHNCVASYIDSVSEGRTKIVFMREKKDIDKSLVTVEIKKKHICQAYQMNNVRITTEQEMFLAKYAENKNLILDNL